MMKNIFLISFLFIALVGEAQQMDSDLLRIKNRLESITTYSAEVTFSVDIDFINMPVKTARVDYEKGKELRFDSDDFVLIPKKGLDFSLSQLLDEPVITVDRGEENLNGSVYKVVNLIPTTDRSDFSIAKLFLDTKNLRVAAVEISTKKEGIFWVVFDFSQNDAVLPTKVTVQFEVERFRLPLNFMGKDTDINRKQMRSDGPKRGSIFLDINYLDLTMD